ncbi:MAG: hypothetical protein E6H60_15075 [Betaproteobacteria bacterium]|nr:MAG: hypothetical protein E6H60_15075 [Betaproteobacteria bacterium]
MDRLLEHINDPADLRRLDGDQLEQLARELREFIISSVSRTGGHLHRPFPYVTNPTIRGENPRPSTALLSQPATGEPVKAASSNTSSL